jgi:hypothetical protein
MCKDRFLFFENYYNIAEKLPDDLRTKFYDALMRYIFRDEEPEDVVVSALITAIKPSLDKEDTRGGYRDGAGRKPNQTQSNEIKNNQKESKLIKINQIESNDNQNNQSFLETGNKKQETGNNIIISNDMIVKKEDFDVPKINLVLNNHNLAEIKKLTPERKTKLKQRCSDVGGFDEFLAQMDTALRESSFLRGDNKNGWKADFDFFLQKSSWQKAIEGGYQDSKPFEQSEVQQQKEREERQKMLDQYWED